ncbi:hypothetical protein STENM327S_04790 [Streptomyces tendae]
MEPPPVRGGRFARTGGEAVGGAGQAVVQAVSPRRKPAGSANAPASVPWKPNNKLPPGAIRALWLAPVAVTAPVDGATDAFQALVIRWPEEGEGEPPAVNREPYRCW